MRYVDRGFTLIEAMVVLAVFSILVAITVPAFERFSAINRKNSAIQQARTLITLARSTAVTRLQRTTVCISNDGRSCTKYGRHFFLLFIDSDGDRLASEGELLRKEPLIAGTRYALTASTLNSFRFRSNGSALSYGNLMVCPSSDSSYAGSLVISSMGRLRAGRDNNGDGVVEGTDGKPLDCSS